MVGIPQTAVWGSFKSSLQTRVLRKNDRNPPNGSLGIVQVLTTDDGSAQEWSESPKRQFGDRSSFDLFISSQEFDDRPQLTRLKWHEMEFDSEDLNDPQTAV